MPTPSEPPIVADDLWKQYRLGSGNLLVSGLRRIAPGLAQKLNVHQDFWAVQGVSFKVEAGEAVGVIGHNGAGKSTLLKLLSSVTIPTRGRVALRGRVAPLIEVGAGFHPELSGRENIYFNAAVLGMSKAEISRKFDAIVAFSGIEKFLDTPVKKYSSGMMVRLGFSVAVHIDPDILLVDEVLAVGDLSFVLKSYRKITEIRARGVPVLLVTHNLQLVRNFCTRALWMDGGKLRMDGTPNEVAAAYSKAILEREGGGDGSRTQPDPTVSVEGVKVVSNDGSPRETFATGEGMNLEITLSTRRSTGPLILVVTVWREETGEMLVCQNSRDDGAEIEGFSGPGTRMVRMKLPRQPFVSGLHSISISLSENDVVSVVDWHEKMYSFRVAAGAVGYGAFHAFPEWEAEAERPA